MSDPSSRVLVTGIGGFFAQAVVKALRVGHRPREYHGCDADGDGIGEAFVDSFHRVPRADAPEYVATLDKLCHLHGIAAVIPGTEPEREILARLGSPPRLPAGTPVISQEASWMDTYGDKLACMRALGEKVELVPFGDGTDPKAVHAVVARTGFPAVVKSRRSSGSKTLHVVHSEQELEAALRATPQPLVQAYIGAEGGEFSAGLFVCDRFESAIAFRRELGHGGCSWIAETSEDADVLDYVRRVARASGLRGAANVQVRKSRWGVRLLELNPRFSSLVAARALCGFRDVEWSLALAVGEEPPPPDGPFRHLRYRRCFSEVADLGGGFGAVREWNPRWVGAKDR